MAGEEDVELRDLVAQTLEAKGVLGKIRVGPLNYVDSNSPFRVQYRVLHSSERVILHYSLYLILKRGTK